MYTHIHISKSVAINMSEQKKYIKIYVHEKQERPTQMFLLRITKGGNHRNLQMHTNLIFTNIYF